MKSLAILVVMLSSAWPALHGAGDELTAGDIDFFEKKIRPLLAKRCYECHSAQAQKLKGGLRLDSRAAVLSGGDSGPAVAPSKPKESLLIAAVQYQNEDLQMPPKGKLPPAEIALLSEWVRRGTPFPNSGATDLIRENNIDFAAGRRFWSFQALRRHALPTVKTPSWPRRHIDTFILAQLEAHDLAPARPADRRQLIRRATFDLLGLPPTPAEVAAFVGDESPDAYARLIDRLLASPRYGERWARFWLDLARYTDTTADWLKSTGKAHLYRDWVVQALNADMPYDDFVRRQLATDMMDTTGPGDLPALGFLGLSPTYWKELKLAPDVIKTTVADEWEERIDAVSRTFLGLTVACARCHDHKFDPIATEDYYALAGVFASTRLTDRSTNLDNKTKDAPKANAVDDAALFVLADGPNKTKLVYKPAEPRNLAVQIRGNPSITGAVVPRRFLAVFSNFDAPPLFQHGSGRLELANAIVSDAAPLAARVIVNRIWQWHIGRGLLTTPSNFGSQGARPSHPQLLDDLAARFVENGWSIKWLHREIMLSAVYLQSSTFDARNDAVDADNRWLWRMKRRRLEIEAWRDAMLFAAGSLDTTIGGAAAPLTDANNRRRTIYGKVHRRDLYDMLRLHDFPDPTGHSPQRAVTTTPLQQLFALNSDFVARQAAAVTHRIQSENLATNELRIRRTYDLLFARGPTERELQIGIEFLGNGSPWPGYSHALLGSNEFLFID
jgi:hypothetical protein